MPGRFLVDSNVVIAFFSGEQTATIRFTDSEILVPSTVLGELYYGAHKSANVTRNLRTLDEFTGSVEVLNCDATTAQFYGRIKNQLRLKGKPIPENDVWIAAIAAQHGLPLVRRDDHFKEVEGLAIEKW